MFTYDGYLRRDEGGRQMIMRRMFEEHHSMKNELANLAKKIDKLEHPDNIPEPLKVMGRKSTNPIYKLSESIEIISKNSVN